MAKNHSIKCTISAKDGASAVFKRVSASTIAFGVAAGSFISKGITGAINGMRSMVNEALQAESANVMLDAALRGVGTYTPELARQFRDLAGAIQDETGTSDEAVKANIALLTSMGVVSGKMGVAARSTQALASLNIEGSMAAKAVARAIDGDITGFERLAPAVRLATTTEEKYAAANQLIAAGYAQQEAKLQTVGGAWEALKGRIGDATEDIIGAIFQGAKLGTTFNEMQASVGKFLSSSTFKGFTDKLRDGAGYVREIVTAMSADGGTKEVVSAMGNVILAALKDGADYVGAKIKEAFGQNKRDEFDPRLAGASRFWGALSGGAGVSGAITAMDKPKDDDSPKQTNLDAALNNLYAIVQRNVKTVEASADSSDEVAVTMAQVAEATKEEKKVVLDSTDALKKIEEAKNKTAAWELEISGHKQNQAAIEGRITKLSEQEAAARQNAINSQKAASQIASVGVAEYIKNSREKNDALKEETKANAATRKRMKRLQEVVDSGGRLSKSNQRDLDAFNRQKNQAEALVNDAARARKEAAQLADQKKQSELELKMIQSRIAVATEGMRADLKTAVEMQ